MPKNRLDNRGVVLLMVLGTVLVVTILANVIMGIMLSQSRFTHHKVSRIQAYYAALAGANFAIENLRTGNWNQPGTFPLNDPDIPFSNTTTIVVTPAPPGVNADYQISVTTDYTLQ
ncbi:hypothetical protein ACFLZ3_00100 [Candidatus Omnitrophota bacterium]